MRPNPQEWERLSKDAMKSEKRLSHRLQNAARYVRDFKKVLAEAVGVEPSSRTENK
jgi:hypothetical protein